jgi:hypothetical protein
MTRPSMRACTGKRKLCGGCAGPDDGGAGPINTRRARGSTNCSPTHAPPGGRQCHVKSRHDKPSTVTSRPAA